jgi:hypothetical protein
MGAIERIDLGDGRFTVIDQGDAKLLAAHRWSYSGGYAKGYDVGRGQYVGLHRVLIGDRPGMVVDHINGDRLDNRRANLRHVSLSANRCNSVPIGGTSRFKGVSYYPSRRKWRATICLNRKVAFLGFFDSEEAAARAYDQRARLLHGEFAKTNEDMGLLKAA